ncbi:MAG TPA: hypothetical protein GX724_02040 [Fibrobacter sp.]|nr:hypothetical protein [Fibrobacter sp.]
MIPNRRLFVYLFLLLLPLFFNSCASSQKIRAGKILSKTELAFDSVQLDSIALHPDFFKKIDVLKTTFFPNPQVIMLVQNLANGIIESEMGSAYLNIDLQLQNKSLDSLWLHDLNATLELDSAVQLPLALAEKSILLPGVQNISVKTSILLDQNLLNLVQVKKVRIRGKMLVSLKENGNLITLNFNVLREITPEEMDLLQRRARESIMNHIVGDWVNAIL